MSEFEAGKTTFRLFADNEDDPWDDLLGARKNIFISCEKEVVRAFAAQVLKIGNKKRISLNLAMEELLSRYDLGGGAIDCGVRHRFGADKSSER